MPGVMTDQILCLLLLLQQVVAVEVVMLAQGRASPAVLVVARSTLLRDLELLTKALPEETERVTIRLTSDLGVVAEQVWLVLHGTLEPSQQGAVTE